MANKKWHGEWWIPGEESLRQRGTLTVSGRGDISLEIIGGFDLSVRTPLPEGGESISLGERPLPLLFGDCEGTAVTLLNCSTRIARGGWFGIGHPQYHLLYAQRAVIGAHFQGTEDHVFVRGEFRFENFGAWLGTSTTRRKRTSEDGPSIAEIDLSSQESVMLDGWEYTANLRSSGFEITQRRDIASVRGDVYASLQVAAPTPVAISEFDRISMAFMDLLTLASGEACGLISMSLVLSETEEVPLDDASVQVPRQVDVLGRRVHLAKPSAPAVDLHKFLFTCRDLPFDECVTKWLPLRARVGAACSVLFGMYYSRPGYTETRLLSSAISAESLHSALYGDATDMPTERFIELRELILSAIEDGKDRAWVKRTLRNAPSLRARLLALAAVLPAGAIEDLIPDRDGWAAQLLEARNGLAHSADGGTGVIDKFWLTETTIYVLRLVLAQELGVPAAVQEAAVNRDGMLNARPLGWL